VLLSDNDDVVEAVPPKGPDHALAVRILPGGPQRGEKLFDSHRTHSTNEVRAIDFVSVPDDVLRRGVVLGTSEAPSTLHPANDGTESVEAVGIENIRFRTDSRNYG